MSYVEAAAQADAAFYLGIANGAEVARQIGIGRGSVYRIQKARGLRYCTWQTQRYKWGR